MIMKKLFYTIGIALMMLIMACENDRQQFDTRISALNVFVEDTIYSFAVKPSMQEQDTVPLYITLIGERRDYDRYFQLHPTAESRLSDDHYRLPDLILESGKVSDTLGLVLIKNTDLQDTIFLLELEFAEGPDFVRGVDRKIRIHVGNKLTEPSNWETELESFFGVYSQVKHTLIIDATGVADFKDLGLGVKKNLVQLTKNHLAELNATRALEGKGPLEDEQGRIVVIGN